MTTSLGIRHLVAIAVVGIALLQLAQCQGAATARARREQAIADSSAASALARVGGIRRRAQAAGRVYVGTVAPHARSVAATDRQLGRTSRAIAAADSARASAERVLADSSATLKVLRVELRRSTDVLGVLRLEVAALKDTLLRERAAADQRIAAAVAEAMELKALDSASVTLDSARVRQVTTRDARRPRWWRRALGVGCEGATVGGGAGVGALAAGPGGAAIGAIVGLVAGHSCK